MATVGWGKNKFDVQHLEMRPPPFQKPAPLPAHTFAKPLPTVLSRAFPALPRFRFHRMEYSDSNNLVGEQPVHGEPMPHRDLTPLGAHRSRLRLSVRRLEDARASGLPDRRPRRRHHPPWLVACPLAGDAGSGACARRSRACRPHSPHPLRELVTSCPRPISVRGQSVAPCRCRRVSASPFLPAPRR